MLGITTCKRSVNSSFFSIRESHEPDYIGFERCIIEDVPICIDDFELVVSKDQHFSN